MTTCAVCAGPLVNDPHGRQRLYCSHACRARAYRDRRDGRLRLWEAEARPVPRPGLERVGPGVYATRDGAVRIVHDLDGAPGWSLVIQADGTGYVETDPYPTLRSARDALGVKLRRRT